MRARRSVVAMRTLIVAMTSLALAVSPTFGQATVLGRPLRWIDLSGRWEVQMWPTGSDTMPALGVGTPTVLPLVFGMSVPPRVREDRPTFAAVHTGTGQVAAFPRDSLFRVTARNFSADSIAIVITHLDVQQEKEDSARGLRRSSTADDRITILLRTEGDSGVGVWGNNAHIGPVIRGKAVLRPARGPDRPRPTRALPPVHEITALIAESAVRLGSGANTTVLSNGSVFVSDYVGKRMLFLDSTLANVTVTIDSQNPGPFGFPRYPGRVFTGQADTVYLPDIQNGGLRLISPDGKFARFQLLDSEDLAWLSNASAGSQFVGRSLYFTNTLVLREPGAFSAAGHDSLYLLRVNLDSRKRDTLGLVTIKRDGRLVPADSVPGEPQFDVSFRAPFDIGDAMAVTSRGELAVIRESDFHVDWLKADGTGRRTPPVQWPWYRLSEAEKQGVADDRNSVFGSDRTRVIRPAGVPSAVTILRSGRLPDYVPAFAPMSAIADYNGNVWVQLGARMMYFVPGPATYAAIDSTGQIVDRIRLPDGRTLIGFDKSGRIYTTSSGRAGKIEAYRR